MDQNRLWYIGGRFFVVYILAQIAVYLLVALFGPSVGIYTDNYPPQPFSQEIRTAFVIHASAILIAVNDMRRDRKRRIKEQSIEHWLEEPENSTH